MQQQAADPLHHSLRRRTLLTSGPVTQHTMISSRVKKSPAIMAGMKNMKKCCGAWRRGGGGGAEEWGSTMHA